MITSYIKPYIRKLTPYASARDSYQSGILLDANENAFGSVLTNLREAYNRYPDPGSNELKKALALFVRTAPDRIAAGNGSDEIIELLIKIFAGPGEEIIVCEPTYGMYQAAANAFNIAVKTCLLTDNFQLNLKAIEQQTSKKTRIIFCCSPNNPTGNLLNENDIKKLCAMFGGPVIVDEAYIEFSKKESLAKLGAQFDNLIILRTLSKAWGLAGLRVGYAVADPSVVRYIDRIKLPYNINRVSAGLAIQALSNTEQLRKLCSNIIDERERLAQQLKNLGVSVFPSNANFLLVRCPGARSVVRRLAEESGIIIRDMSDKPLLADCFRITVGTPKENKKLIQALKNLL